VHGHRNDGAEGRDHKPQRSRAYWRPTARGALTMSGRMELIMVEQEIARELASPADALRVALMMLARRGRLEIGDVLKVLAPN